MKTKLIMIAVLAAMLLAACYTPATPRTDPTVPPSVLPTQAPSVLPTQPPSPLPEVKPGGGLMTRPESAIWNNAPEAALKARAALVQHVEIDPDMITLVSVEAVEWPDGCLGVHTPGMMCTMVITPGYRVVLEVAGTQYEYHTNESGSVVRLATPTP